MEAQVRLEDKSVIGERKKAELIQCIRAAEDLRKYRVPEGKKVVGYFLDGSPILEDK